MLSVWPCSFHLPLALAHVGRGDVQGLLGGTGAGRAGWGTLCAKCALCVSHLSVRPGRGRYCDGSPHAQEALRWLSAPSLCYGSLAQG